MPDDSPNLEPSLKLAAGSKEQSDECLRRRDVLDTAARIKLIREAFGFSQRELAKRAGVTNSSISMIEQGQVSPSIQLLARILTVFPISLADFFNFLPTVESQPSRYQVGIKSLTEERQQLDAVIACLSPGQSTAFTAAVVDSCGVVISGHLQLTSLSENSVLNQGDHFYFSAGQPYRLINLSHQDSRFFRCSLSVR